LLRSKEGTESKSAKLNAFSTAEFILFALVASIDLSNLEKSQAIFFQNSTNQTIDCDKK
jgi:hypothetical protein